MTVPVPRKPVSKEAREVGALIKQARRRKKLKQATLADHLSLSQPHLSRIENGDPAIPSNELLVRAAKFLDIEPRDLLRVAGRGAVGATFEELTLDRLDEQTKRLEATETKLDEALKAIVVLQEAVGRIERRIAGVTRGSGASRK